MDPTGPPAPHPVRRSRIDAGDVKLAVTQRGDPAHPTVVLVHGYPDTQAVWDELAELLADRFHVVSYDVRGAGASTAPGSTAGYAFPLLIGDLEAVIQRGEPGPAGSPGRPRLGFAAVLGGGQHAQACGAGGLVHLDVRARRSTRPRPGCAAARYAARGVSPTSRTSSPGPGTSASSSFPGCPRWPGEAGSAAAGAAGSPRRGPARVPAIRPARSPRTGSTACRCTGRT